eukprot:COSAG01_NODE_326_length_18790_cov_10.366005_21_plen_125_part_00
MGFVHQLKKAFAARAPGADHNVDGKTEMLRTRFELLHQRLQRDPKFQLISDEFSTPLDSANAIAVTPIGALLGSEGPKCVFGMLSKHERVQLDGQGNAAPVYRPLSHRPPAASSPPLVRHREID